MFLFYWLIFVMPLEQHYIWGRQIVAGLTIVKALGILSLFVAAWRAVGNGRYSAVIRHPIAIPYCCLLIIQLSSYVFQGGDLVYGGMAYSHVLSISMLFLAAPLLVDTQTRLYRTLLMAVAAIGFTSLYAVRQQQKYGGEGVRASGMFSDANQYSVIASLWLPVAVVWILSRRPLWERGLALAGLIATLLGTTAAASRGGSMAIAAGFLYLLLRMPSRVRNLIVAGTVGTALLVFSPTSVLARFQNPSYGDQVATESRRITWTAGLKMIRAHPLAGVGLQNFIERVARYEDPNDMLVVGLAHNTYIEVGAELGLPGLAAYLLVLAAAIYSCELARRNAARIGATHLARVALALQAGIVAYAVGSATVTIWWEKMVWLLLLTSAAAYQISNVRVRRFRRRLAVHKSAPGATPEFYSSVPRP